MAKLIVKFGEAVLGEYPLTKVITSVGRAAANDIVIDHPAISAYHARFEKERDGYTVEDINSTNGTNVNGKRVARLLLTHMTTLTVGRHTLLFDDPEAMAGEAEATMIMGRPMEATVRIDLRAAEPSSAMATADATMLRPAPSLADATMLRPALSQVDADATMVRMSRSQMDADATMMRPTLSQADADATMMRPTLSQADADATMMRPAVGLSAHANDATMVRPPAAVAKPAGIGRLTVVEGGTRGAEYLLTKRVTTIGEVATAEIRIKGLFAPKVAAMINRTATGYVLNPTPGEIRPLINGKAAESAVLLQHLDTIEVVNLKLQFSF